MKVEIILLQMARFFKEIPNQPKKVFEMIYPVDREMGGKVLRC